MKARETVRETTEKVNYLRTRTEILTEEVDDQNAVALNYKGANYTSLEESTQMLLGTLVNNTLSLAALLNNVIE